MDMSAALTAFVQESRELLARMEDALLQAEAQAADEEMIAAIFRAAHTIKGSAGLFAMDGIVSFTHVMESVLDCVRDGAIALDAALVSTLLSCRDHLDTLIDQVDASASDDDPAPQRRAALIAQLQAYLDAQTREATASVPVATTTPDDPWTGTVEAVRNEYWHLSLRFSVDVLRHGMDPLSFIQYLSGLGQIVRMHTVADHLPPLKEMDAELCYIGFEIDLASDRSRQELEDVFEFVREDGRIRILAPQARIEEYIALIDSLPEESRRLGQILVASGALTPAELESVLAKQQRTAAQGDALRLGEILIDENIVSPSVVAAAISKQQRGEEKRSQEQRVLKVEAAKLDQLIDLVGELVIATAGAKITATRLRRGTLIEAINDVSQLVEQIRDRSLDLRMIPVGEVFTRFPRVVRDVSHELGKKIDLVITGQDTELDKSMVEKLSDPLLHIVRNAIDHGIEPVEQRIAVGKPEQGRIHLHAFHESGYVVIEVSDDGKGLDTERIRQKAVDRGMIEADANISPEEIHQLIFAAGFSTAEEVTNLSGRGVGMDVVKRSIEQLRGEVEIETLLGQGTTLRIRLPLTLAIIDGFQVAVGNSVFVVPLDMVEECVEFVSDIDADYIDLRGQVLPFIRISKLFKIPRDEGARENIVVVKHAGRRFGIVVDMLLGEAQTVIKPLCRLFSNVNGIGGSSILGSGDVALILDIPMLLQQTEKIAPSQASAHAM